MTDATSRASHAHDHAVGHARLGARRPARSRPSPLEASAAARILGVSIVLAALWAGVFWALH